jgi:hypothetical protein
VEVRPAQTLKIEGSISIDGSYGARRAERLERVLDLLDKMTTAAIGSGRGIQGEVDAGDEAD